MPGPEGGSVVAGRAGLQNEYQVTTPHHRLPRAGEPPFHAPNAALLIDFDNVTLGIRSDLAKELKTLLSSEIIKGKVAVSRAYADWRRYQQYVVPLTESSIDLIYAPAMGTSKKNATDIRLAVDAIELVFTRPEIGTFILLSGDSDFSTLVIKLKEYGKYVIGVGIRESASDLLIQNCDEYYSYSDLAGLTRATDVPSAQRDPWELVREAVEMMVRNRDVMRSDRLKQVMQQIDPNFDEKNAGFNRFSKFITEAGHRGLVKLAKLENGQYEVGLTDGAVPPAIRARPGVAAEAEEPRGRRGRGRGRGRERGNGRRREPQPVEPAPPPAPAPSRPEPRGRRKPAERAPEEELTLARSFELLGKALAEFRRPVGQEALRLRMTALHGRQDPMLESSRFLRLLRQAHDAEVADVRKLGEDEYEVVGRRLEELPAGLTGGPTMAPPLAEAGETGELRTVPGPMPSGRSGIRFRRGARPTAGPQEIPLVGVVKLEEEPEGAAKPARRSSSRPATRKRAAPRGRGAKKKSE
jgi:uncharacterized protein (TIGR00288 family)